MGAQTVAQGCTPRGNANRAVGAYPTAAGSYADVDSPSRLGLTSSAMTRNADNWRRFQPKIRI